MNKQEFQEVYNLAVDSSVDLHQADMSMLDGFGTAGFQPVVVSREAAARMIRYQCVQLNGQIDADKLQECQYAFRHKVSIVGPVPPSADREMLGKALVALDAACTFVGLLYGVVATKHLEEKLTFTDTADEIRRYLCQHGFATSKQAENEAENLGDDWTVGVNPAGRFIPQFTREDD